MKGGLILSVYGSKRGCESGKKGGDEGLCVCVRRRGGVGVC